MVKVLRNIIHGDGPNTGAMAGYPPGIRGDVITSVKIPLSKLSKEVQQVIRNSDLYKATAKDLLSPGRDDLTKPEDDLTKPEPTKPEPPLSDAEKEDQKTRADGLRDDMLGDVAVSPDGYQDPDSYVPGNIIPIRTPGHNYGDDEGYEIPDPFPDGKPGLDIRKVKKPRLGGSAGEIAGVDAATAASTAAQTLSRRKKKGGTQIAYGGYSI